MLSKTTALLSLFGATTALHEYNRTATTTEGCVAPGTCTPPDATYQKVAVGPSPGQQWNINGG